MVVADKLRLLIKVLDSSEIPSTAEVVTVKLPSREIEVDVSEIAPSAEIPLMLLTVPTVSAALLASVNESMPIAAIFVMALDALLNV